mmetsp:Transcript_6208/g.11037  ORF Transcript_6208/g.11037 Transcript_6208/m.11037 type:complete len:496 (-) Transcript_6208:628-2115(-)
MAQVGEQAASLSAASEPPAPCSASDQNKSDAPTHTSESAFSGPCDKGNVMALLSFYRERFNQFESERKEWMSRVGSAEVSHVDLHKSKWELRVRQEEIAELQNALSDANVQLFQEREEALKLLAENDEMKAQVSEDRRKIQHLLALTEPVSQEVTFFKDCRPYLLTRGLGGKNETQGQNEPQARREPRCGSVHVNPNHQLRPNSSSLQGNGPGPKKVLRTIYLPNEQTDALTQRIESLEHQLEEQSRISKDRIQALEKDRGEREALYRKQNKANIDEIKALEKKLANAEKTARTATSEYLEARHAALACERTSLERTASLTSENKSLRQQLATMADRLAKETQAIRTSIMQDKDRHVQRFKRQSILASDTLNKEKGEYSKQLASAKEKIKALSSRNAELKSKCAQLEQRRNMDFQGFSRDIADLRKKLRAVEGIAYRGVLTDVSGASVHSFESKFSKSSRAGSIGGISEDDVSHLRSELDKLQASLRGLGKSGDC